MPFFPVNIFLFNGGGAQALAIVLRIFNDPSESKDLYDRESAFNVSSAH